MGLPDSEVIEKMDKLGIKKILLKKSDRILDSMNFSPNIHEYNKNEKQ